VSAAAPDGGIPLDRVTWRRFVRAIRTFLFSEVGTRAKWMLAGLVGFLLIINGLNVLNSYVGRDFITAITERDQSGFVRFAILYIAVFAGSTLVAVIHRFLEERLGLLWRGWLTDRLLHSYLEHPNYFRLSDRLQANGEIDNPDQRIAEDVRAFTTTTLSFVLLILNGALTVVAFSGVLWEISRLLFLVAILYAGLGSFLTIAFGYRLVGLNYAQLDKEASFRAELLLARTNAESVALSRQEGGLLGRLERRLDALVSNFKRIISVNRNVGFFTTGYNYLIQIIPALIVGPLYMRGAVEFGVVTQSAMAFSQLLGAFSLIITQFQSISSFTAVIARLGSLAEAIEQAEAVTALSMEKCVHDDLLMECPVCLIDKAPAGQSTIAVHEEDDRVAFENLTLREPRENRVLVDQLSVSIPAQTRVAVLGPNHPAKMALFRAAAGIWETGTGRVVRPGPYRILFLPERPYLMPGTLREILASPRRGAPPQDDARIAAEARELGLGPLLARVGGIDAEDDWGNELSLGEQQLLSAARIVLAAPRFVFLERPYTTLTPDQVASVLDSLTRHGVTYVTLSDRDVELERYDSVLELRADGSWDYRPIAVKKPA
jgi:putative ATP-binding cassette transporter